jgi:hypothetical protein
MFELFVILWNFLDWLYIFYIIFVLSLAIAVILIIVYGVKVLWKH